MRKIEGEYMYVAADTKIARTIEVDPYTLLDVAEDGRIVGVETIGYPVADSLLKVLRHVRVP